MVTRFMRRLSSALEGIMEGARVVEPPGVFAQFEEISPERAMQMLEKMEANRTVSERHVNKLKKDMVARRWKLTGQGITFDANGRLVDGQHRLWAIIEGGVTVTQLVVYGADPEDVILSIDLGRGKSFGDIQRIKGEQSYNALAAAVGLIAAADKSIASKTSVNTTRLEQYSHFELQDLLDGYRERYDLDYAVKYAHRLTSKPLKVPHSAGSTAYFLLAEKYGDEQVEPFFHQLSKGEHPDGSGLERGLPVKALRARFITEHDEKPRPNRTWYLEAILRTFVTQMRGHTSTRYQTPSNPGYLKPLPERI
jgi:hypothetical protein